MKKTILVLICLIAALCLTGCSWSADAVLRMEKRFYALFKPYLSQTAGEHPVAKSATAKVTAAPSKDESGESDPSGDWMSETPARTAEPEQPAGTETPAPSIPDDQPTAAPTDADTNLPTGSPTAAPSAPTEAPPAEPHGGVIQLPIGP